MYVGTTVKLACPTKLVEDVLWRRWLKSDYMILYVAGEMERLVDPRLTVDQNCSYAMVIANVTADDSALYGCQDDYGFGNYHLFILTVAGELHCFVYIAVV